MDNLELLEPEQLYKSKLRDDHDQNVRKYFDNLVEKSKIDKETNRVICKKYYQENEVLAKLNKKSRGLNGLKLFFIFLCLIIIGIFLLIFVYKPKRKTLDEQIKKQTEVVNKLLEEANAQMAPLNNLFEASIPSKIMQTTTPLIEMDRIFDVKKYELLHDKYGLWDNKDQNSSTLDIQSGSILGNPFVVFKDLNKTMVNKTYENSIVISYTVGSGNNKRTVVETLTATVTAPMPVYSTETYLVYGNEGGMHLSFTREPSNINTMDEKEIDRYVRHHEKDLTKLADKALKKGGTYTPLGNPEFELFFGGLDRDNEVEYRLLFTPLGQKSMMQVLKSKIGYGDDFKFTKIKGLNVITSKHSQGEALFVNANNFKGFDYDKVEKFFIDYNNNYFRCLFFDFAPLLSIPLYQQLKAHEYIYKNNVGSNFNCFEHEVLANHYNVSKFLPEKGKTRAILKTNLLAKSQDSDIVNVVAHSFDTIKRVSNVTKIGGDGRAHIIPVEWIEYVPVKAEHQISVSDLGTDDEIKFNSLGQKDVIYAKGLVSTRKDINVDINLLKSRMKKD